MASNAVRTQKRLMEMILTLCGCTSSSFSVSDLAYVVKYCQMIWTSHMACASHIISVCTFGVSVLDINEEQIVRWASMSLGDCLQRADDMVMRTPGLIGALSPE